MPLSPHASSFWRIVLINSPARAMAWLRVKSTGLDFNEVAGARFTGNGTPLLCPCTAAGQTAAAASNRVAWLNLRHDGAAFFAKDKSTPMTDTGQNENQGSH